MATSRPPRSGAGDSTARVSRRAVLAGGAVGAAALGAGVLTWTALPETPPPDPGASTGGPPAEGVSIDTPRGRIRLDLVAPGVVRVRIGSPSRHSYAVERPLPALPAIVTTTPSGITLEADDGLSVGIDAVSGAISARKGAVTLIEEAGNGWEKSGDGYRWRLRLPADETCHGLGQRAFGLSLRDRTLQLWNFDAGSYRPGDDPLYLSVPFYLGHRPDATYGIFWDDPGRARVALDVNNDGRLVYENESGRSACLYLLTGDHPAQIVQRYTGLTGRMDLPPLWALGYHQSRWSYRDADEFRMVARRMRAERIPCDALHFDIDYMDGFRVFTWDRKRFPDPEGLLAELATDGFATVAITNPGLRIDPAYPAYREAKKGGFLLTTGSGGRLIRTAWGGRSEFPDFTDPAVRRWWAGRVGRLAAGGLTGLWTDMNEPSVFDRESKTLPDDTPHDWEGQGNTHAGGGHGVYGMQMARATREGLQALRPDRRPFVLSRSGYAGAQRYAVTWNGDSRSSWEHLRITVPQLLNLGMSGIPFSGSDAGGFRGDPDAELYLRWLQLASMTPFFRTHSARTSRERNPWSYGRRTTNRVRTIIERRYRLLPYLYTAVRQACVDGTPIVRPMFFEVPGRPAYQAIDDQFLLGDSLLVAPILEEGRRSRDVVLPPGDWYRFGEPERLAGDRVVRDDAGMGLPLYVRAGSVVPTCPLRQHTSQAPGGLVLDAYAGDGVSALYEDEGEGFGYREGRYRNSIFTSTSAGNELRVRWVREGGYEPSHGVVRVRAFGVDATTAQVDGRVIAPVAAKGVVSVASAQFDELTLGR